MIVTVASIILGCLINSMAGFAFTCFEFKGKKLFYPLVLISFMVPFEAIAIPLYNVADSFGIVNIWGVDSCDCEWIGNLFVYSVFQRYSAEFGRGSTGRRSKVADDICKSNYAHFNSGIYNRTYDFYESVEFLYVASFGSAF